MSDERAARRRAQREAARKIVVGDNVLVSNVGHAYEARPVVELPAKIPGVHRWVVNSSYTIPELTVGRPGGRLLDHENLFHVSVGCIDCEQPYPKIQPGSVCPAGDTWSTLAADPGGPVWEA